MLCIENSSQGSDGTMQCLRVLRLEGHVTHHIAPLSTLASVLGMWIIGRMKSEMREV